MLYRVYLAMSGIRTLLVVDTDYTSNCKSNYRAITTVRVDCVKLKYKEVPSY